MGAARDYTVKADVIRHERIRHKWTQEDLAHHAGLSTGQVSRIESGKIESPHFGTLKKIADALGVSDEDLIEWPRVLMPW
jgi:transcriptional regulator with XRE-family HTH domain